MSNRIPVGGNEDECDLGFSWRKSSYSLSNGQCVEVARLADGRIGVRDSKAANGPVLRFEPGVWADFLRELRTSEWPYSKSLSANAMKILSHNSLNLARGVSSPYERLTMTLNLCA